MIEPHLTLAVFPLLFSENVCPTSHNTAANSASLLSFVTLSNKTQSNCAKRLLCIYKLFLQNCNSICFALPNVTKASKVYRDLLDSTGTVASATLWPINILRLINDTSKIIINSRVMLKIVASLTDVSGGVLYYPRGIIHTSL